jgi:acetyl-CoA carboxylase biotin carboxyl carrier protein
MDLSYVKKLVKLLAESGVDEIEIEEEGKKIRIAKHTNNSIGVYAGGASSLMQPAAPPLAVALPPSSPAEVLPQAPKLHEIKSPIVGTFYRAPAPDAAAYVEAGSVVQPGTVLCIVEAMKLMNEIESDVAGKIVKIMVENGHPVEYDQTLFLVENV